MTETRITREASIASYVDGVRRGIHDRNTRFMFNNGTGAEDVSAEVLAVAGPETDEERELRAVVEEKRFPMRLAGQLESELTDHLFQQYYGMHFVGEKFELDEHEFEDEVILVRKRDGKRYRIEVDVYAEELAADPPPDDRAPGAGQQALV